MSFWNRRKRAGHDDRRKFGGGEPLPSRYRIGEKPGAGGMRVVHRAEDISLERPVALKFLSGTSMAQEQILGGYPATEVDLLVPSGPGFESWWGHSP